MELEPVHYFIPVKNRHHGEAIATGFRARKVDAWQKKLEPNALHLIGGLQFGSLELMQQVRNTSEPYIFFDRAYFSGGPGTNRLRATRNAYQQNWIRPSSPDRFRKTGIELKPWRKDGRHIMLVPPGEAIAALFDFGPLFAQMRERLMQFGRPVMVSVKGDARPLSQRLRDCWCVVTWTSNVAVEAICAGVPAFVSNYSAAAPVAGMLESMEWQMESPKMPEREAWANSLAYGEFSVSEIESGYARSVIMQDARP
jgi:hypothetical protein